MGTFPGDRMITWHKLQWGQLAAVKEIDIYCGYRIAFPVHLWTAIYELVNCLIHHHGVMYTTTSDRGAAFTI